MSNYVNKSLAVKNEDGLTVGELFPYVYVKHFQDSDFSTNQELIFTDLELKSVVGSDVLFCLVPVPGIIFWRVIGDLCRGGRRVMDDHGHAVTRVTLDPYSWNSAILPRGR